MENKEKAIIYNRVSTKEQSPELQVQACKEYVASKGWQLIDVLEEKASAYKDETKRIIFNQMIERAKKNEFNHIVVWNMDRFSRQPEVEVLNLIKNLSLLHNVEIHSVNGDLWSELVESIGKLKSMGFIGEALTEFLEKLLRGFEFQRAHRESKVKSERVKLAVVKVDGNQTISYKGNVWGRRSIINERIIEEVLKLSSEGKKIREISNLVYYYDESRNKRPLSKSLVHKIITKNGTQNNS